MAIFGFNSCKSQPLETVKDVDLNKYLGLWYEVASFPQKFQKGCRCTTAEYAILQNGDIEVVNKCQKPGKFASIKGKAFVVKNSGNAKLKVQFFWPFKGDYWIIDLDTDYKWAVVGHKNRKYCWILARRPNISDSVYNGIVERLSQKSFDITKLQKTQHDCK